MMVCIAFGCSCGPSANSPGSEQLGYPEPHPSPASWADIAASLRARVARFLSMPAYRSPAVEPKGHRGRLALRAAFPCATSMTLVQVAAAGLMVSRYRTTLDDEKATRRWRKLMCAYCKQPFLWARRHGGLLLSEVRC